MKLDEHLTWCRAITFQSIILHRTKFWLILFSVNLIATACGTFKKASRISGTIEIEPGELLTTVEKAPEFPGGELAFTHYLQDSIEYPVEDKLSGIEGRVYVEFEIHRSGQVIRIKLYPGTEELGTEAMQEQVLRAIRHMPKWTPAYQNDRPVDVKYLKLVRFRLYR